MKNKIVAGLLAIFLGWLGVHKFYLGKNVQGVIYLIFCWSTIPLWIAFVEGILLLVTDKQSFDAKYNASVLQTAAPTSSQQEPNKLHRAQRPM